MQRNLKFPKRLVPGDTIGIVAPSSDASFRYPHRVTRGVSFLEGLGFKVKLFPSVFKSIRGSAGTPEERAEDLHLAFSDPSIKAIVATIGGLTLNEVMEYLDFDLMYEHAKLFCGYSDCSLLHAALLAKGPIVSFYGPGLLAEFAEFPCPPEYTVRNFLAAAAGTPLFLTPAEAWTDELLNWETRADLDRGRVYQPNDIGFKVLRDGVAHGASFLSCLPSLISLLGTEYLPPLKGTVLFIETPEGESLGRGMSLENINSALGTLRMAGVYNDIEGLVVGRVYGHDKSGHEEVFEMIEYQTRGYYFPVIANVDFGHTDPMLTLPCGVSVNFCTDPLSIRFEHSGVI